VLQLSITEAERDFAGFVNTNLLFEKNHIGDT